MPYFIESTVKEDHLRITTSGRIDSIEPVIEYGNRIITLAAQANMRRVLLDELGLSVSLSPLDAVLLGEQLLEVANLAQGIRVAAVCTPENYETLSFIETSLQNRSISFRVFKEEQKALNWLLT